MLIEGNSLSILYRRGASNEYPQHVFLWRIKTKYLIKCNLKVRNE